MYYMVRYMTTFMWEVGSSVAVWFVLHFTLLQRLVAPLWPPCDPLVAALWHPCGRHRLQLKWNQWKFDVEGTRNSTGLYWNESTKYWNILVSMSILTVLIILTIVVLGPIRLIGLLMCKYIWFIIAYLLYVWVCVCGGGGGGGGVYVIMWWCLHIW